jgi:hypothetical protein
VDSESAADSRGGKPLCAASARSASPPLGAALALWHSTLLPTASCLPQLARTPQVFVACICVVGHRLRPDFAGQALLIGQTGDHYFSARGEWGVRGGVPHSTPSTDARRAVQRKAACGVRHGLPPHHCLPPSRVQFVLLPAFISGPGLRKRYVLPSWGA